MASGNKLNEMAPPRSALSDPNAQEILRAWIGHNQLHLTFSPRTWEDPFAWGIAIVDLMNHLARAYEAEKMMSFDEALARVKAGFDAEWSAPTDAGTTHSNRTN